MKFFDLRAFSGKQNQIQQAEAAAREMAAAAGFVYFEPSSDALKEGRWVLIGYAFWNGYNLQLLDELMEKRQDFQGKFSIAIFDFGIHCTTQEDYDRYFPIGFIKGITRTPVVCWFENGNAVLVESGFDANPTVRERLLKS